MTLQTSPEQPAPVRQIAQLIGGYIDRLGPVWVEGQVTQINRRGGSNIVFMVLRDKLADISMSLTCQRAVVDSLPMPLVDGAQIVVNGKPRYYGNRGTMSLEVREIRPVGEGQLLAQLEKRRQLLAAEGLFADALKRPLPFLPNRVGLITAQASAAERDVLENSRRRWPGVDFEVKHAVMQGPHSAREVIEALDAFGRAKNVDVIVIARGGGSVEDLLPFSDEALIRCVSALAIPVVSAIGHEQDSPLLDLVADVRASTPTDAARRVVPDVAEEREKVIRARDRIRRTVMMRVMQEQSALQQLRSRPALADPRNGLADRADEVAQLRDRARRTVGHRLDRAHDDLGHQLARVRSLSPLATLRRGYAVLADSGGNALSSVAGVSAGDSIHIRLADGRLGATTTSVEPIPLENSDLEDHHDEKQGAL